MLDGRFFYRLMLFGSALSGERQTNAQNHEHAADELAKQGIDAEVIDFYSLKPWDQATLAESLK